MLFYRILALLCWSCAVMSFPMKAYLQRVKRDVDTALVPSFGWEAGINPDGTGNCDGAVNGANGKPIQVPCSCPPNSTFFLAALNRNVASGFVTTNPSVKVTFPTDNSTASQLARLNAAAVTLQNLEGAGVGCPVSSTTFSAQQKAIEAEASGTTPSTPAVSPSAPPVQATPDVGTGAGQGSSVSSCSATSSAPATTTVPTSSPALPSPSSATSATIAVSSGNDTNPTDAQISALAPPLGWQSGINPDGTGNCDGAVDGSNGKPILVPCQCPPDQTDYISNLTANIRAGHVLLNPTVLVTFPTDNSTASQSARLNAAAVTIQNLNGAGKGCPVSSTTFSAQGKAISAESSG